MTAIASDFWHDQADDPEVRIDARIDPQVEEAYWQSVYWTQPHFHSDYEYEDYAPAYCVGYIGYAQYGGSFADAEKSLCANWVRIKGGSRLSWEEALPAIRAAWNHAEQAQLQDEEEIADALRAAQPMRAQHQPAYATA